MPRHEDMDYRHTKWHCDDCWDAYVQEPRHKEMVEALSSTVIKKQVQVTHIQDKNPKKPKEQESKGGIPSDTPRATKPESI